MPPTPVPQTLKHSCRMTGNEMNVGSNRLLEQTQKATALPIGRHCLGNAVKITRQVKDHPRFSLRFEVGKVCENLVQFFPLAGAAKLPSQLTRFAKVCSSRSGRKPQRAFTLHIERFEKVRLALEKACQRDVSLTLYKTGKELLCHYPTY